MEFKHLGNNVWSVITSDGDQFFALLSEGAPEPWAWSDYSWFLTRERAVAVGPQG